MGLARSVRLGEAPSVSGWWGPQKAEAWHWSKTETGSRSQLCHFLWDAESPALSEPLSLSVINGYTSWSHLGIK